MVWLYKLIPSLWYFKVNCSRYFTVNGMRPSTHSFILEVKFRGTCLSEVPKPLQSGLACGGVLGSMGKTRLVILLVIQYRSKSFVFSTAWINLNCEYWKRWWVIRYGRARNAKLYILWLILERCWISISAGGHTVRINRNFNMYQLARLSASKKQPAILIILKVYFKVTKGVTEITWISNSLEIKIGYLHTCFWLQEYPYFIGSFTCDIHLYLSRRLVNI